MRWPGLALALLSAICCSRKELPPPPDAGVPTFPALPRSEKATEALIAAETRRPPGAARAAVDATAILDALEERPGAISAGAGVVRRIQSALEGAKGGMYLLVGHWHDAPAQIAAFRRLVGPGGLRGLDLVAIEQLRATGHWSGALAEAQRGDDEDLERWAATGDRGAFAALAERHRESDYAAWKLGIEADVLDLLAETRAAGVRLVGCDMPSGAQALAGPLSGDLRSRLREIHCARSLSVARPRNAALLWGEAHVGRSALRRFLPPEATVLALHLFGGRPTGDAETALAKRLVVHEPVFVPLGDEDAALLLPEGPLAGTIDRVLADGEAVPTGLVARADATGRLTVGDQSAVLGTCGSGISLPPGDHAYVFRSGDRIVVGALRVRGGRGVELSFDTRAGVTSFTEQRRAD